MNSTVLFLSVILSHRTFLVSERVRECVTDCDTE